jgi:hypothetical protein
VINIQDTGMTINNNPRVKLTLQVQPDGQAAFQATKIATVSRLQIPRVGDEFWVRYDSDDPSEIEFDTNRGKEQLAAAQAQCAAAQTHYAAAKGEHDAMQLPPDLAANGIRGRGSCVAVQKAPEGNLVRCQISVKVRLVDGTPPYDASCDTLLPPERADKLVPRHSLFPVCADRNNHMRIALVPGEPTPVVALSDAGPLDPALRALSDGDPCQVTILEYARQYLRVPNGEEVYAVKVQVDGTTAEAMMPVPDGFAPLVQAGRQVPAKRIAYEPKALAINWSAM